MQFRLNLQGRGIRGAFMRESDTRTLKPKKLLTATMKRRALKLKSIEVLPTKARNPQVRALVVSAPQPSGMCRQPLPVTRLESAPALHRF
jgi:hypothetical protein